MPPEATRYRVLRCQAKHPFAPSSPCAMPQGGMRVENFDAKGQPPNTEWVKRTWGSGAYRFMWFEGQKLKGVSPPFVWDDPNFPQRAEYTPATPSASEPGTPAAGVAGSAPANPLLEVLKTQADTSGKVDLTTTLVILQAMAAQERQMRNDQEERDRRWRAEDERRARQREEEHARDLEKIRAQGDADRKAMEEFWERQNEQAGELRRAARGEDVDDELGELADSVKTLAEAQKATAQQTQDMWSKVLEMAAPAIPGLIQRFTGGAPQLPPNGAK